jgi:hypothetical protein
LNVNSSLVAPRGRHVFKTVLEIPELNKVNSVIAVFILIPNLKEVICNTDLCCMRLLWSYVNRLS